MATYLFSFATKLFCIKPYIVYLQILISQCRFTLICPKGSSNKNPGYCHLLRWAVKVTQQN